MEFAQLKIEAVNDEIRLTQDVPCDDPDIIMFPMHQAEAICKAIMALAAAENEQQQSQTKKG